MISTRSFCQTPTQLWGRNQHTRTRKDSWRGLTSRWFPSRYRWLFQTLSRSGFWWVEGERAKKGCWRGSNSKIHVLYLPSKYRLIGHVFPTEKPPERGRTFERIRNGRLPDPLEPPTPFSQVVGGSQRTTEYRLEYSTLFWRFLAAPRTYLDVPPAQRTGRDLFVLVNV